MNNEKWDEAVESLKESMDRDYQEGQEKAVEVVKNNELSPAEIDNIIEDSENIYQYQNKIGVRSTSNAFRNGFRDALVELSEDAQE